MTGTLQLRGFVTANETRVCKEGAFQYMKDEIGNLKREETSRRAKRFHLSGFQFHPSLYLTL